MLLLVDQNCHVILLYFSFIYFLFKATGKNCHSTYNYEGVRELKLLWLCIVLSLKLSIAQHLAK